MPQLLERPRRRSPFAVADVLSQMGETICFPDLEIRKKRGERAVVPATPAQPAYRTVALPPASVVDEEPERWDGMS